MPENNKFDIFLPRLFTVSAEGRNSEKAGVIHPFNSTPDLKVGAIDISKRTFNSRWYYLRFIQLYSTLFKVGLF